MFDKPRGCIRSYYSIRELLRRLRYSRTRSICQRPRESWIVVDSGGEIGRTDIQVVAGQQIETMNHIEVPRRTERAVKDQDYGFIL